MLGAWLDVAEGASAQQLAEFARLLELPDPELERYLVWGARPADPALAAMVAAVRELHP
jgi:succinate dehydrogenase flavin-adding protein (antitoxin of CptAB toxin-antitoxin module)